MMATARLPQTEVSWRAIGVAGWIVTLSILGWVGGRIVATVDKNADAIVALQAAVIALKDWSARQDIQVKQALDAQAAALDKMTEALEAAWRER